MGRQQDLLFCKIAISTGLVTQEQAQKCLSFCDRRELEGERRPAVGAVFARHSLMNPADVKRINEAVGKRLRAGSPASDARRSRRGSDSRPRGEAAPRRRREGRVSRGQSIDPNTMWMGIAAGVVFLAVLGTIAFLVLRHGKPPHGPVTTAATSGSPAPPAASSPASSEAATQQAASPSPPPFVPPAQPAPGSAAAGADSLPGSASLTADPEFEKRHAAAINDARNLAFSLLAMPERAASNLEAFLAENLRVYEQAPHAELKRQIAAQIAELRRAAAQEKDSEAEAEKPEE